MARAQACARARPPAAAHVPGPHLGAPGGDERGAAQRSGRRPPAAPFAPCLHLARQPPQLHCPGCRGSPAPRPRPPAPCPPVQAQAVLAVTRSFSLRAEERGALPDGDDASNGAAAPSTSGGQQQHQAQQPLVAGTPRAPHQLQGLAAPPADWSLKSSVRVFSSVPFPGLTPAALCATRPGVQPAAASKACGRRPDVRTWWEPLHCCLTAGSPASCSTASQACERLAPCSTSYTPGEVRGTPAARSCSKGAWLLVAPQELLASGVS
jgi:hypothetical protein